MGLILWIIIGIILASFLVTTLWIFFNFLKNTKRDYNLYKSVFKSVFSRKLSLSIIVIFYMISFGLVGGLTSALGGLNKEATKYIKENHLYQGVARGTEFNDKDPTTKTLDQKSFYLATQGVIDFYNENINPNPEDLPQQDTNFLDMLGGQAAVVGETPSLNERLDGSNSPLSFSSNSDNVEVYNTYSINDIALFWNTWYEKSNEVVLSSDDQDSWKNYGYNGDSRQYEVIPNHKNINEGIVDYVENIYGQFILFDDTWTIADSIKEEGNGLDTFSEVIFVFFDNDINKYFAAIGTYFFEYYIDFGNYDPNNLFASSDVYEYQKTFHGTNFLLQSYNKNQIINDKNTVINNPGTDKNGDYAINTVTFYDDKGKEIAGPQAYKNSENNDEFFKPHQGTLEDPYRIYVSAEYYDAHNWTKSSEAMHVPTYDEFYVQVEGSYRSPTYSFPMQTISSSLQKPENNAAILINTQSLLRLTRSAKNSTDYYEFFGFSNIYDATNKSGDWYYAPYVYETIPDSTFYLPYVLSFNDLINSFLGDSKHSNSQTYYIDADGVNNLNSVISYRSFAIIREIHVDGLIYMVVMGIFLLITIIVLILLIKKRIQDSNKQIGTIKALGYGPGRIASAYTIFPIIIIILGGIMALTVALPLSLWFTSLYSGFFSLNLAIPYVGLMVWIKIFIVPLIISMFIGYWMAYYTIKKPTLDLLNNVDKDKPNWIVRGTSHLIPSFASFEFTYKTKGIGRAFFKSLLLFGAILGSMSITSFAFASSTMTATMTKQVFDIIDYKGKKWEKGAPFIEDININDKDVTDDDGEYIDMEEFNLFPDSSIENPKLIWYMSTVLWNPEGALNTFQNLVKSNNQQNFDFSLIINLDPETNVPTVESNYYIDWKTAIALWATNVALHVPIDEEGTPNPDLEKPIMVMNDSNVKEDKKNKAVTFHMISPILDNYALNISTNIVVRYGKDATFKVINFGYKVINDYNNVTGPNKENLKEDLEIIITWFTDYGIKDFADVIMQGLADEDIFNDIVFNKNYYDGAITDEEGNVVTDEEINQTMTTANNGYFFETDLRGNLTTYNESNFFHKTSTYMEGYASTEELIATNNVGSTAEAHINKSKYDDGVVNVAMTQSEFKEVQRYKAATPSINGDLTDKNQARIFVNTKVWNESQKNYNRVYIPVVFDIEIYDSIYPLGTFFLQEDLDGAINYSINEIVKGSYNEAKNNSWYSIYGGYIEGQLKIIDNNSDKQNAFYQHNYSVTYNIDTEGKDFITAPFSVSLSQEALSSQIQSEGFVYGDVIPFSYLVDNYYVPFSIPISINIIIEQGSRVYELLQGIFYIVAFFALFIGITIVMIAMKDIMDSNKREVSMFKAFGYSNGRATSLVIVPYIFVIITAFIIAIPFSLIFLSLVGTIMTLVTGTTYVFGLVLWQWIIVVGFIIGLIIFLGFVGYKSYQHTNALEAISETNE